MTEHDPARSNRTPSITPSSTGWRTWFTRERCSQFLARLRLNKVQSIPGLPWILAAAAIAIIIQSVGLANLIAVHDEQQQWSAAAGQRQALLADLSELERQQQAAREQLHLLKGQINHESGRLAELQGELKLTQSLRDDAQKAQAAAAAEAARLGPENEAIAGKVRQLNVQLDAAQSSLAQLQTQRDKLATDVAASKKALDDQLVDAAKAAEHARQLDAQAAATLEAIRKSREAQIKSQAQLDELTTTIARAAAEREGADARLKAAADQLKAAQADYDSIHKQLAAARADLAAARKTGEEQAAAKAEADATLASLKEKLDKATKVLAEKQGATAAQEAIIVATQQRHDALSQRVANLTAELKPLEEQRLALEADIAGKRREMESLRERANAAREDLKSAPAPAPRLPSPPPAPAPKPDDAPKSKSPPAQPPAQPPAATPDSPAKAESTGNKRPVKCIVQAIATNMP